MVLRQMTDLPWQFILLGSGDPVLENAMRAFQNGIPGARPVRYPF